MKPMMALSLKLSAVDKKIDSGYIMEPKYDGMRLLLQFDPDGVILQTLTRSGRDVLPQVPEEWCRLVQHSLFDMALPDDDTNWIDMEFGYRKANMDLNFNRTMRVMGSGPVEAQRKAEDQGVLPVGVVFDMPTASGPLDNRHAHIRYTLNSEYAMEGLVRAPLLSIGFHSASYISFVDEGFEGIMLKRRDGMYEPGARRANTWYKVKKVDTVDAFVTGYKPGQGKYAGQVGALEFSTTDRRPLGYCSGMTDADRILFTEHIDDMIRDAAVIEVGYYGLTAGTPRHPQFLRMRPDRTASSCSWFEQNKS
jgi:ATP-dependent DNA ligase